ncbi:MAG: laccase domain-containing protein, partial [Clostridium sp.]|nr:laccase domain-containing protein [Clostridium sp.]
MKNAELKTYTLACGDILPYYSVPALEALPMVRHVIATRGGGVSEGIFRSMNLSFSRGDKEEAVRENFRRIFDQRADLALGLFDAAEKQHIDDIDPSVR